MKRIGLVLLVACLTAWQGCGGGGGLPTLGQVSGTVTLDGKPLAGASVRFEPEGQAAMSHGMTDANGKYELWYTEKVKGAALGKYVVRIETPPMPDPATGKMPVPLPAKYNTQSTLSADIKAGDNPISFELTSR